MPVRCRGRLCEQACHAPLTQQSCARLELCSPGQDCSVPILVSRNISAATPSLCHPAAALQGPGFVPFAGIDGQLGAEDAYTAEQGQTFFEQLTSQAGRAGVTVDVIAAGVAAVNIPLLAPLAHQTGGMLLMHESELTVKSAVCVFWPGLLSPQYLCEGCIALQAMLKQTRLDLCESRDMWLPRFMPLCSRICQALHLQHSHLWPIQYTLQLLTSQSCRPRQIHPSTCQLLQRTCCVYHAYWRRTASGVGQSSLLGPQQPVLLPQTSASSRTATLQHLMVAQHSATLLQAS